MNLPASSSTRLALEAVLFDLDGTVVDTIPHILASFRHATAEVFGSPLADDVLLKHVGIPLQRQMYSFTDDDEVAARLLASYRAFNHETHDEMARLFPDTRPTLEALRHAGLPMGIVTSKSAMMAHRALDLFDLEEFFEVVVTADDTTRHKPDPAPIVLGASLLGIDPSRCGYVGDSPADVTAAREAGAVAIAATWGVASRSRLEEAGPDIVIDSLGEFVGLLGL